MRHWKNFSYFASGLGIVAALLIFERKASDPASLRDLRKPASGHSPSPASNIEHVVIVIQENHSFDSYFGLYCKAPTGSNPSCDTGPLCCEAGPRREPSGLGPVKLTDQENIAHNPNHFHRCEGLEINGGKMDRFVTNAPCANRRNFAYATRATASTYWQLAANNAMADRYFQPIVGASYSNNMYLARAQYVFTDDDVAPRSIGSRCGDVILNQKTFTEPTIGDLLTQAQVSWAFYAEGYDKMLEAHHKGTCPRPEAGCENGRDAYPCIYDPADVPFEYYRSTMDRPENMKDFDKFAEAIRAGELPAVSYIKSMGFRTEHPALSTISAGMDFVSEVVNSVANSSYAANTLVLITHDESGGYFDHIAPPPASPVDHKPYGPRIPLLAVGRFARKGVVSHVTMEHSSLVRFIEWNWLGTSGQLHGRDAIVNNIGSLLDPEQTGVSVPTGDHDESPPLKELPGPGTQPLND